MTTKTDYTRHEHHEFLDAADVALQNANLQLALSTLGDTLGRRNREAFANIPEMNELRERARGIKNKTLSGLDRHLQEFETQVVRRGGHVHYAADGEEACQIVINVLQQAGARKVVKSKSMTSEEIHLNKALEKQGMQVVETDFGEYIIQVAGQRPSHLVAPAVHLRVPEVAQILSKEAGRPLPEDAGALAQFAREKLRQEFSHADAGITGANFAIAETGSIVLVSNEGNARLTTSLPRLHIAIFGMEKILPKLADLPIFLKILARAATGQTLSVYTSLITGARRAGELDGPQEFHAIVLDNGRSKVLAGPLRESLFCIRCGACLNACPIFRTVGGHAYGGVYSGPIGAVLTPLYDGLAVNHHLPHASSLCGACQAACPVKIQIPEMLITLRDQLHQEKGQLSWKERIAYRAWGKMLLSPRRYRWMTWLVTRTIGKWYRQTRWMRRAPGPAKNWTIDRDFLAPSAERFRDWWNREGQA